VQSFTGVKSVHMHEKYGHMPHRNDFDIAVIELPTPLTFNDYVQPVCLASTPVAAETDCVATGWGDTQGRQRERTCTTLLRSLLIKCSDVVVTT